MPVVGTEVLHLQCLAWNSPMNCDMSVQAFY